MASPPPKQSFKDAGEQVRRRIREPSESLMRVPQHVAHAIQAHIRQKKTIETRMTIKA